MRLKAAPDDHHARTERAYKRSAKRPRGQDRRCEADGAEEYSHVRAGRVRVVREAVEWCAPWPCVQAYQRREEARVERDCGAYGDAPWEEEDDPRCEGERVSEWGRGCEARRRPRCVGGGWGARNRDRGCGCKVGELWAHWSR